MTMPSSSRGIDQAMARCRCCGYTVHIHSGEDECPRCRSRVRARKADSAERTTALLAAAVLLYVPANLYPIMTVQQFGRGDAQTIYSGVVHMIESGFWSLAAIVFVASVVVPLLKFLGLAFLVAQVRFGWTSSRSSAAKAHMIIEMVGRWSMIDVFTIALLVALVQFDFLTNVTAGPGAVYFGAVVVLTMLASESFDPRSLFDQETTI